MASGHKALARRALGLPNSQGRSRSNNHWTTIGSPDHAICLEMAEQGLVRGFPGHRGLNSAVFELTRAGAERALEPGEALAPADFTTIGQD